MERRRQGSPGMAVRRSQSGAGQQQGAGQRENTGREGSREDPQRPALPEVCHESTLEVEELLSFPRLSKPAREWKCPFGYVRETPGVDVAKKVLILSPNRTA